MDKEQARRCVDCISRDQFVAIRCAGTQLCIFLSTHSTYTYTLRGEDSQEHLPLY